jgi:hypothetical protein
MTRNVITVKTIPQKKPPDTGVAPLGGALWLVGLVAVASVLL